MILAREFEQHLTTPGTSAWPFEADGVCDADLLAALHPAAIRDLARAGRVGQQPDLFDPHAVHLTVERPPADAG